MSSEKASLPLIPHQWFLLWCTHRHYAVSLAEWLPGSPQISLVSDFGVTGVSVSSFSLRSFWASYASWDTFYLELSRRGVWRWIFRRWKQLLTLYLLNQEQPQKWTFTDYRPVPRGLLSGSSLKLRCHSRIKTKQSKIQVLHQSPPLVIVCKF